MNRDPLTGRFISHAEACALIVAAGDRRRRWERRERLGPPAAVILATPTDRFPRWRLRVFDRCWPWRASRGQAVADALASRNGRREDGTFYLDACAFIQRDPPPFLELARRRYAAIEDVER